MPFLRAIFILTITFAAHAATEKTAVSEPGPGKPIWETCDGCANPESAYYDPESGFLFVSNVNGDPSAKDTNGFIQQFTVHGKIVEPKWVGGLNAPKGMRAYKGLLWVSDIDEVLAIDIASAKVMKRITVPGATFLNDVAIAGDGTVYVSDTVKSKIYQIKKDKPSVFLEGQLVESPNGLLVNGNKLVVGGWGLGMKDDWSVKTAGSLFLIDLKTKKKNLITKKPLGNLDGLELTAAGDYLVSDWMAGKIYRVTKKGQVSTHGTGYKNSADLGYVGPRNMLVVPRMGENLISAYSLSSAKTPAP